MKSRRLTFFLSHVGRAPSLLVVAFLFSISLNAAESCVECHAKSNYLLVASWNQSRHAAKNVGCVDCHGDNHSAIFTVKGEVSAGICAKCHPGPAGEFSRSLHAVAMDKMKADPKLARLSSSMAEAGCVNCHQIGKHFADGSVGKCNSCHSGHSFSAVEARRPQACAQCHSGPDHPQLEIWQSSKHGQLYASDAPRAQTAVCVTCHMPQGSHDTSLGLSFGTVANGAALDTTKPPVKMRSLTATDATKQRDAMLQTCLPCHSSRLAAEALSRADAVKTEADRVLAQAVEVIRRMNANRLIKRPNGETASGELILGIDQYYDDLSPVEQRFFDMSRFHHATTFKGAYHQSPVYAHNEGFLKMKQDLDFIKNEEVRARALTTKPNQSSP